ncbi:MAG TPA: APC family permease, partial [Gemmatimonadales bacterium]|nr:APC family permease [Gemmatimonadales bacterium]
LGALTLAELGAMLPRSGGQYVFARQALGDYAGFVIGWSDWVSSCGSMAVVTVSIGEYTGVLFPALAPYAVEIAILVTVAFTVIHGIGIRTGDIAQQITSLVKVLVLVGLAVACLAAAAPARGEVTVATHSLPTFAAVIVSLQGVIYTYDGWNGVLYFSGEVQDPGRQIPRAMAGGVILVIAIYLLLNLAYFHILPLDRMAGQTLVAATAARSVFGPSGETLVRVVAIVSLFSAASAILLLTSRIIHAMSEDGLFWSRVRQVTRAGSPVPALVFSALLTAAMLVSGTFDQVLAVTAFFFVLNYLLSFVSVLVLRWREPSTPRPYRAWGYPVVTWLLLLGSLAFLGGNVLGDWADARWALALLVVSYPIFRLRARPRSSDIESRSSMP